MLRQDAHISVALLLLAATGCNPTPQGLSEADLAQIRAIPERGIACTLSADWDRMNEDYAEDVLVLMPNTPELRGKAALRDWQEQFPPVTAYDVRLEDVDGRGDLGYARLSYTVTVSMEGTPMTETGRGLWILRKADDGRWRIAVDITHSDAALPSEAGDL